MTMNLMAGTIKFDRPIDVKKHYISLGGFSVTLKNFSEPIEFDFESFEGAKDADDPSLLQFLLRGLDIDCFPESIELLTHVNDIESFEEFFVYTGESSEDEEIIPVAINELSISFNAGDNDRDFGKKFIEQIPIKY